jgi:HD superfamily phosphohydrolase
MQFSSEEAQWIFPFVDHENLQRLRHIKQAGLCDWFFPGAVHTRFNHSLGCCYVAGQIANKIGLSATEKQTVMLACLLHDIGHGPFSHVFEDVFYKKSIRHEMWTPYFIKEFSSEAFLSKINKKNKTLPITPESLLTIEKIIMHQEKQKILLVDIVSSQLDADRLDYLLRDSHFCGVKYGEYDFRWLLHCLTIVENKGKKRLGVISSGIGAVEHYLMARRLMTQNVYQYPKKNACEFFLTEFLKYLAQGLLEDKRFEPVKQKTLAKFIIQVNHFNSEIKTSKNKEKTIQQFLKNNYEFYKTLYDYDVFSVLRECAQMNFDHPAILLAKRIQTRALPKAIAINPNHYEKAKLMVDEVKEKHKNLIDSWQLRILNLPHQSYQAEHDPLLMRDESGKVKHLHERSFILNVLSDRWESSSLVSIDQNILHLTAVKQLCEKLKSFI